MFNKILIALDRDEMSQEIFQQGLRLAKLASAKLMLLHVLSSDDVNSPDALVFPNIDYYSGWGERDFKLYQERWDAFKNEGFKMLKVFHAQAKTQGVDAEFTQNSGSPGRVICEIAKAWQADLIIMGRRGYSGLTEFFLGSVSNYVLHHAPCSIHVVHFPVTPSPVAVTSQTTTSQA